MKYVWIVILILIDVVLFVEAIKDIMHAVHVAKEEEKNRVEPYTQSELKEAIAAELEESTIGWFIVNITTLFVISMFVWLKSRG